MKEKREAIPENLPVISDKSGHEAIAQEE